MATTKLAPKRLRDLIGKKIKITHIEDDDDKYLEGVKCIIQDVYMNEDDENWLLKTNIKLNGYYGPYHFELIAGIDKYRTIKEE